MPVELDVIFNEESAANCKPVAGTKIAVELAVKENAPMSMRLFAIKPRGLFCACGMMHRLHYVSEEIAEVGCNCFLIPCFGVLQDVRLDALVTVHTN